MAPGPIYRARKRLEMALEPFVWADWLFNSPATPHARIFRNVIQATSRGNKIGTSTVRKIKASPFTIKYSRPFFTSFRIKRAISATYVFSAWLPRRSGFWSSSSIAVVSPKMLRSVRKILIPVFFSCAVSDLEVAKK